MKILLLEDDLILSEIIEEHLVSQKYEVTTVFTGLEAQDLLYCQKFDLLLLDVNVPILNGFELLEDLRQQKIYTPTIFLTSLNQVDDIEKGFKSGCDDYIKKPFELKELDIRINNIKRLFNIYDEQLIQISENIYFDKKNLLIKKEKEQITLAKKESEVLEYLINNDFLTEEELDIVRKGRNAKGTKCKSTDIVTYRIATGLEYLFGVLYIRKDIARIEKIIAYIVGE